MGREFVEAIEAAPIVAAVKDDNGLEMCLKSDIDAVFILYGDICTISDIVARVKDAGKIAMVHMDLINGLSSKDISTDFIRKYTRADGIITTKGNLITHAKEIGLATVLRYFVLDSMALINIEKQSHHSRESQPDMIEILPACDLRRTDPGEGGCPECAGKRCNGDLNNMLGRMVHVMGTCRHAGA